MGLLFYELPRVQKKKKLKPKQGWKNLLSPQLNSHKQKMLLHKNLNLIVRGNMS